MTNDDSEKEIKNIALDLDLIQSKVPSYPSEKLCEMIVCERYFGFHPKVSIMCMEELAKRRIAGDAFLFEEYIENAFNSLPKLEFGLPDLRHVLLTAISHNKKK